MDIENWISEDISGASFNRVSFDVIGPLPITDAGNRVILTVIDYYSDILLL